MMHSETMNRANESGRLRRRGLSFLREPASRSMSFDFARCAEFQNIDTAKMAAKVATVIVNAFVENDSVTPSTG